MAKRLFKLDCAAQQIQAVEIPARLTDQRRLEMATATYRDSDGAARDTDIACSSPIQALRRTLATPTLSGAAQSDGGAARLPSFILRFAEPVCARIERRTQLATETFEKGEEGARDTDISAFAMATQTHVAKPPISRDTDIEQLDFAPIGAKPIARKRT